MKVGVYTPSLTSHSGGVGMAILNLYSKMCESNNTLSVEINSLNDGGEALQEFRKKNLTSNVFPSYKARTLGLSLPLLSHSVNSKADVNHLHGVWMLTSYSTLFSKIFNSTPYIISPHGMLDPWIVSRGQFKKILATYAYEKWSWKNASVFHALNSREAEAIHLLVPKAKIVIAPNGIDVDPDDFVKHVDSEVTRILFLGRFHPKKNLHSLATAICNISDDVFKKTPFILDVIGWGDALYEAEVKSIASQKPERFNFLGPKFGEDKENVIKNSHCFILPSFSEGQPVAVIEAMRVGVPVLINENCNMPELSQLKLTDDCGVTVESIQRAIITFLSLSSEEKRDLRQASFEFVKKKYSWEAVLPLYEQMYLEQL
jgi:glycosyltransferase involved in cell wall biosynthesis